MASNSLNFMPAAVRRITTVTTSILKIQLPDDFLNQRVEIVVSPCKESPTVTTRQVPTNLRNRGKILEDIVDVIIPTTDWAEL